MIVTLNNLHFYSNFFRSLRYSAFHIVSIMTTTGYVTADYPKWNGLAKTVLFVLMFIGGCAGSTGGSIKVIRIYTLLKQAVNELKYNIHPKGVFNLMSGIEEKPNLFRLWVLFFLYIATFMFTALLVSSFGVDSLTSIGASVATLGNIGPGFGKVDPVNNYAWLHHR